ncbi:MAG: sulfatase [Bacteroidales bacterium]|nr:sulfatase [Bacteroidales bacterium]
MNLKNFILVSAMGLLMSCVNRQPENAKNRPNIVFIMTDDHATQAISCYGSDLNKTPHIDRMADQGMRFANAFVTNSISAPSRAVALTGKYSHLNGIKDNHDVFDSTQVTFPKLLRANGYETAIVGKWHLKSRPSGFDYWNVLPGQGLYYNPEFIKMGKDTVYEGYVTDITTDLALEWLEKRNSDKPFMMMIHHKAPHRNWMPDTNYLDKYDERQFPKPASFYDDYEGREHMKDQKLTIAEHMDIAWDFKVPCDTCPIKKVNRIPRNAYPVVLNRMTPQQRQAWEEGYVEEIKKFYSTDFTPEERTDWNFQRYMEDYLRTIISVDNSIGKINQYLEKHGLAENTLVIYTSDQGFFLGEHGIFDKRYMYEESLRTPLIMKYPGKIKKGLVNEAMVQNIDFAPTFLDVAGVEIPGAMQGRSLTPLFRVPDLESWRDAVYYRFYANGWGVPKHHGVRTENFKLIHFETDPNSWELYNLKEDPHELNNLYGEPEYREKIRELKDKMEALEDKYQIPEEKQDNKNEN